jgi:ABC-type transport system substrate-binding protein
VTSNSLRLYSQPARRPPVDELLRRPDARHRKYKIKVTVVDEYTVKVKWTRPYFADEFTLLILIIPAMYSVDKMANRSHSISCPRSSPRGSTIIGQQQDVRHRPMKFGEWTKNERLVRTQPRLLGPTVLLPRVIFPAISNPNTAREMCCRTMTGFVPTRTCSGPEINVKRERYAGRLRLSGSTVTSATT